MTTIGKWEESNRHQSESGFTLIELLVAMAILGFLSILLFSGLRFGARIWDRSDAHLAGADDVRIAQQLLLHAIGDAYPLFLTGSTNPHVEFDGSRDRMILLAPPPAALGPGGLAHYEFSVDQHDGKVQLAVTIRPELARTTDSSTMRTEILLADMKSLSFAYLSPDSATWLDEWNGEKTLPRLIRIDGKFFDTDPRIWPELLIATRIEVDVSCVFDPLTRGCRGRG